MIRHAKTMTNAGRTGATALGRAALGLVRRAFYKMLQPGSVASVEVITGRHGSDNQRSAMLLARQSGLACALIDQLTVRPCVPPDIAPAKLSGTGGSFERENPLLAEHAFEMAHVTVILWLTALNRRVATRSRMAVENGE